MRATSCTYGKKASLRSASYFEFLLFSSSFLAHFWGFVVKRRAEDDCSKIDARQGTYQDACHVLHVWEEGLLEVGDVRVEHRASRGLLLERRRADRDALVTLATNVDRDRLKAREGV